MKIINYKEFQERFKSTDQNIRNLFNFFGKDTKVAHFVGWDDGEELRVIFTDYE